ncbi:proteolipid protein 2 [Aethina tumida]|uniref:proteolipid protein 2 n=1 Tax=Aethina tumida TaxID=116153 RepID=UPI00096AFC31|nr:proteolipid protein 2 [Aethina tumida]
MMTETVVNVQEAPNNNAAKPQTSDQPLSWIKFNVDYFKTTPGLIKIAELIIGILCMSLATPYLGGTHFFLFVATTSFIATLIWVVVYLLGVREALPMPINWILTELVNTAFCTLFYILAFIVQLAVWSGYGGHARGANIAAGVFGILNSVAYGFGAYLLYLEHKSNRTT